MTAIHPQRPPARPRVVTAAALALAVLLAACGNDTDAAGEPDDDGTDRPAEVGEPSDDGPESPDPGPDDDDLLAASGGAPAARGATVDEPPGDPARRPLEGFGETAVAIERADGTTGAWCVLLAATATERGRGLMEVTDLGGYTGMLFVFDGDSTSGFFMRNTPMPLSIAWFDAGGALVSTADMEPFDETVHQPTGSYRFALEVTQGELAELGVDEESRLTAGGPCRDRG